MSSQKYWSSGEKNAIAPRSARAIALEGINLIVPTLAP